MTERNDEQAASQTYAVRFTAIVDDPLEEDAAERLTEALRALPGIDEIGPATTHAVTRRVTAGFSIVVSSGGMGDAARDGSRFAKEALRASGMDHAQLVQFVIELDD